MKLLLDYLKALGYVGMIVAFAILVNVLRAKIVYKVLVGYMPSWAASVSIADVALVFFLGMIIIQSYWPKPLLFGISAVDTIPNNRTRHFKNLFDHLAATAVWYLAVESAIWISRRL